MKKTEGNSQVKGVLFGIYAFAVLVCIAIEGYHFGIWLKGFVG